MFCQNVKSKLCERLSSIIQMYPNVTETRIGNQTVTLPFLLPVKFIHNVRMSSYLINTIMGLIRLVVSVVFHTSPEKPSQYLKIQKTCLNFPWRYCVCRFYLQLVAELKMLPMCMDCACSFCKLYILICPHMLWVVSAVFSQGQHVVPPR